MYNRLIGYLDFVCLIRRHQTFVIWNASSAEKDSLSRINWRKHTTTGTGWRHSPSVSSSMTSALHQRVK